MVDPQQNGKGNYEQWSKEESDLLLKLMVDGAARGWRDSSGIFSKQIVEGKILPVINSKLGCNKTYNNYQSRLKWFKKRWTSYSVLMRFNSGFGFDSTTKRFTASSEVWDDYFKAHPNDLHLRYGVFQDYEDLEIAIGNGVATEKNSIGLDTVAEARTSGVGEDRDVHIEGIDCNGDFDAFVRPKQNDQSFQSTLPLHSRENLDNPAQGISQKKRSRTVYERSPSSNRNTNLIMEKLDEISTKFEEIYSLLEAGEREREYTIWDAIKETPNLEEYARFKAVELLDTKTKQDVFLNMAPEERSGWISHKMRGREDFNF